jgi:hypothetical protein
VTGKEHLGYSNKCDFSKICLGKKIRHFQKSGKSGIKKNPKSFIHVEANR